MDELGEAQNNKNSLIKSDDHKLQNVNNIHLVLAIKNKLLHFICFFYFSSHLSVSIYYLPLLSTRHCRISMHRAGLPPSKSRSVWAYLYVEGFFNYLFIWAMFTKSSGINVQQVNREEVEKFAELVNIITEPFEYTFKEPTMPTLFMAGQIWNSRSNYGEKKRVTFYLENPKADIENIIQKFALVPSIILCINGQKIENTTLIKEDATNYYEGELEKLLIYNKQTKSKFIGKVKSATELIPEGEGLKLEHQNSKDQTIYRGEFKDGKKCGYGREERKYYKYEGEWEDNEKNGLGTEYFLRKRKKGYKEEQTSFTEKSEKSKTDEDVQKLDEDEDEEKEKDDNESEGSNEMKKESKKNIYSDDELKSLMKIYKVIYQGPFQKGVRSGDDGVEYTKYGVYEGRWENGMKNGNGKMKYKSGAIYEGEYKNGIMDGEGIYIDEAKNQYKGHFEAGTYDGEGTMTYVNGDSYSGMWSKGRKHGTGTYTYSDGDYYDGQWEKDSAEGTGDLMTDGLFFQGTFKKGMKDGLGELTDENGDLIKGIWRKNKLEEKISVNGELVEGSQ